MQRVSLKIDSRLDATPILGKLVFALCTDAGLSAIEANLVEVSVIEAVNNSIEHAYQGRAGHDVEVVVTHTPDALMFDVCDSGRSADPAFIHANHEAALDISAESAGHARERGRGLAIIQQVMDSAKYTAGREANCFRLVKRLKSDSK